MTGYEPKYESDSEKESNESKKYLSGMRWRYLPSIDDEDSLERIIGRASQIKQTRKTATEVEI
jgi:hypothetical protein